MTRIKKISALVLALFMLLSVVGVVSADTNLEVTYINADSSKIMIDFSHEVDVDELKAAISLVKDGVGAVAFDVEAKEKTVTATRTSANTNASESDTTYGYGSAPKMYPMAMTANTDYSYVIIPTGGITLDTIYQLNIAASLQDKTHTVQLAAAFKRNFRVNKLWIEDFNSYTDTASTPWMGRYGSPTLELVTIGEANKAYKISKTNNSYNIMVAPSYKESETASSVNFADTGVAAATYWARSSNSSYSEARHYDDYNIELSFRVQTPQDMIYVHGILIGMEYQKNGSNVWSTAYNAYKAAGIGAKGSNQRFFVAVDKLKSQNNAVVASISDEEAGKTNLLDALTGQAYGGAEPDASTSILKRSNLEDDDYTNDNINKISMSVLEDNIRLYANDTGFVSYESPIDLDGPVGYPEFGFMTAGATTTAYIIDDIIATKYEDGLSDPEGPTTPKFTVTSSSYDSSAFTVVLSEAISAASLQSKITLLENDAPIAFTVANTTGTTYTITPNSGVIDFTKTYSLTIPADTYTDSSSNEYELEAAYNVAVSIPALSVAYWNADTSKIMLDLTQDIDPVSLKSGLTVLKGSEDITAGCVVTAKTHSATSASGLVSTSDLYTYTIAPAGGIDSANMYSIELDAGIYTTADSGEAYLASDYAKLFIVDRIITDTFDYTDDENGTVEPYIPWNYPITTANKGTKTIYEEGTNKMLKIETTGRVLVDPTGGASNASNANMQTYANTGKKPYDVYQNGSSVWRDINQYNYEVKVKIADNTKKYSVTLYGGYSPLTFNNADHVMVRFEKGATTKKFYAKVQDGNNKTSSTATSGETFFASTFPETNATAGELKNNDWTDLSFSVKGDNVKCFMNDGFFSFNYPDTYIEGMPNYGVPFIEFNHNTSYQENNTFYVDDVIISKAREVSGFELGAISVKNADTDADITALSGVTNVKVSVPVTNAGVAKACKCILAIYDSSSEMLKNVSFADTAAFNTGVTNVSFPSVAVNNGDILRVFFWEDLTTLKPYFNCIEWPVAP